MRSQQQAERAEQQRIKSLVLNYDLTDDQHDGEEPFFHYVHSPNSNRTRLVGRGSLNRSLGCKSSKDDSYNHGGQSQHSTSPDCNNSIVASSHDDTTLLLHPVDKRRDPFADETEAVDHPHGQFRQDKAGNTRSKQRARRLQLGDIDWYGTRRSCDASPPPSSQPIPLEAFVVHKKQAHGPAQHSVADTSDYKG